VAAPSRKPAAAGDKQFGVTRPTLEQALSGRDNALGLLRLVLAGLVLVDHSFPLGGFGDSPVLRWTGGQDTLGGLAVGGFFLLSGYLVTKSAVEHDPVQFLWRRALRIVPAYWAVLVATAFVVGPAVGLAEKGSLSGYLQGPETGPLAYILENLTLTVHRWGFYDLLRETTPYGRKVDGSVFNGSIWSLEYEWRCYLLVGLLSLGGLKRRAPLLAVAVALGLQALLLAQRAGVPAFAAAPALLRDPMSLKLTWQFLVGAVLALQGRRIPVDDRVGALCLAAFALTLPLGGLFVIGYPALGYGLLWLAVRLPERLRQINQREDLSYGFYLWAFPVQQVAAFAGVQALGWAPYVALTALATAGCALASWRLVERPALRLKDRGPGLGWARLRAGLGGG
jgi:peptidoglycan/LPS O-acetylase OafA/YrhL